MQLLRRTEEVQIQKGPKDPGPVRNPNKKQKKTTKEAILRVDIMTVFIYANEPAQLENQMLLFIVKK